VVFLLLPRPQPTPTLFPYTTLFRSKPRGELCDHVRIDAALEGTAERDADRHRRRHVGEPEDRLDPRHGLLERRVPVLPVERLRRSEEHTSELQSRGHLVCRLLLEKK